MIKKIRRSGDNKVRLSKHGTKPPGVNTNRVTQVPKHIKDPLAGKKVSSTLDDEDVDVIILT